MNGVLTAGPVWYLMRGSGVVSLLLLTAVSALGMATVSRWRPGRVPRFVTLGLHRNLSLLAVVFLAIHVLTAVVDPQASVRAVSVFVPAISDRYGLWLGLAALALDLVIALVVTSLLRRRLPDALWRGVHWLAYLAWPVALLHGAGMGTDNGCDLDARRRRRLHRALRRGGRTPADERPARRHETPGAESARRAVSALAAEPARPRAAHTPAATHARGRRPLAERPPRALRPAAGAAARG